MRSIANSLTSISVGGYVSWVHPQNTLILGTSAGEPFGHYLQLVPGPIALSLEVVTTGYMDQIMPRSLSAGQGMTPSTVAEDMIFAMAAVALTRFQIAKKPIEFTDYLYFLVAKQV